MSRSKLFDDVARAMRIALYCETTKLSPREALARLAEVEEQADRYRPSRREFLVNMGTLVAASIIPVIASPAAKAFAGPSPSRASVGIVGAGLAGLACGDELKRNGINAAIYDADTRTGGRCQSLRGFFPGQTAERGGEFIDNLHKTMLAYVQRFNLPIEDVNKRPGEVFYYFNGQLYDESVVVDEFRDFVAALHADLRALSGEVTADNHTATDVGLDHTNLLAYLEEKNGAGLEAGPVAKNAIIQAYEAEYGLEAEEQSCLNFLLFIHADKRAKFTPFGIFSDERYHVIGGNDQIVQGLARELANQIHLQMRLVKVRKTSAGSLELTFKQGASTLVRTHDAVVLAMPFTLLREVQLDANLDLPREKMLAIEQLGYGTNAKMMVGFSSRPWYGLGSNGASYSDLSNHQATWETNPINGTDTRGILTDYSSGRRGANLESGNVQAEASRFLTDLDLVYRGARAAATVQRGQYVAFLEHWPSNPLAKGSYTCYMPGQFTTIAGNEGKPVGNLHFAGEHANSFYEWQGFMEGACLSGIDAAHEILQDLKRGHL
jgi:monoamine oxidase